MYLFKTNFKMSFYTITMQILCVLFFFYNYKGCGFLKVVCGFLLLSDSRRMLLSRLLAMPEDGLYEAPFYYVALALLAAGLTVCVTSAIGVWATYLPGYIILTFVSILWHFLFLY